MVPRTERKSRGWSLTLRLSVALTAGAFFVAVLLGFLGADHEDQYRAVHAANSELELANTLAARAGPLLERNDLMRMSVLTAVARDQSGSRVLVLDRNGRVVLDTALVLGDRQLGLLAGGTAFQRMNQREGAVIRETLAPIRFGGDVIGELRVQKEIIAAPSSFHFTWFGLVLLSCLTLVAVAVIMGYHWSARVRNATDALIRLSAGEVAGVASDATESELQDLDFALQQMERGVQEGLQRVGDGYVTMALQVVEGLERGRLVAPGHGERTARFAARLAERLHLLPADRSEIELACRLIDLGKASVRPSILQKQGTLTETESQSLQNHPVRAADQLECVPGLRRVGQMLRHQMERYDGTGSPDGLRGDRIPLGARIITIASNFDLLLSCRPEQPLDCEAALAQLAEARGEVFDPWLLEMFEEEMRSDPPTTAADRPVMIVPAGAMPWRTAGADAAEAEEEPIDVDLEVMLDEGHHEDAP